MSRFTKNKPPSSMGPAQPGQLAYRSINEMNGRKRLDDLCERITAACRGDAALKLKAAQMFQERKTALEIAIAIGIPVE